MSKKKRSTLPKDFDEMLEGGDSTKIIAVFETCDINAKGGYAKQTALAFDLCPDDVARWLVSQGADLAARDTWGNTPLHNRARSRRSNVEVLLELGADINNKNNDHYTALHSAAASHNVVNANLLITYGANINEKNDDGLTPLALALRSCRNIDIEETVKLAEVFLNAGADKTTEMKSLVQEIGKTFEFHRSNFDSDSVGAVASALEKLYQLFDVEAVPKRQNHDGKSPIITKSDTWQKQHAELWNLLVPSSGHAVTVQGEVIRISGRIANEIEGNGGINWDSDFKKMADALTDMLKLENNLPETDIAEVASIVKEIKTKNGDTSRLAQLAVKWVGQNSIPTKLEPQKYKR